MDLFCFRCVIVTSVSDAVTLERGSLCRCQVQTAWCAALCLSGCLFGGPIRNIKTGCYTCPFTKGSCPVAARVFNRNNLVLLGGPESEECFCFSFSFSLIALWKHSLLSECLNRRLYFTTLVVHCKYVCNPIIYTFIMLSLSQFLLNSYFKHIIELFSAYILIISQRYYTECLPSGNSPGLPWVESAGMERFLQSSLL